jgi:rSAM/selenodomain-associated transferase 1
MTLGLMARSPVPGCCKTRLSPPLPPAEAAELYRAMLEDSFAAYARVELARLVVMVAPEHDGPHHIRQLAPPCWEVLAQRGEGLGERLRHAFATLGVDGHAVALVDSDSPTAPIGPIEQGLRALTGTQRALVGPCEDGGYYLIGLGAVDTRSLGILEGIPWSTSEVMTATRTRASVLGIDLDELPTWYDVDEAADLTRLKAELGHRPALAPRTAAWLRSFEETIRRCELR